MISKGGLCYQVMSPEEDDGYYARIPMVCGPMHSSYESMERPSEEKYIFGSEVSEFFNPKRENCPDGVFFLEQAANNKPYALVSKRPFMQTDATDDGDLVDDIPPRPAKKKDNFFILFSEAGAEVETTSTYCFHPVEASVDGGVGSKTVKVWVPPDLVSEWKKMEWNSKKRPAEEPTTVAVDSTPIRSSEEPEMNKKRRRNESEITESTPWEVHEICYDVASKRGDTIAIKGDIEPWKESLIKIRMKNIISEMFSNKDSCWTNPTGQEWKYIWMAEAGDSVIELTANPEQPNEIWEIKKVTSTVKVWEFPTQLMLLFPFYHAIIASK